MGRLTTHVLDLARGCPASGLTIELWAVEPETERRKLLRTVRTNADGRTDEPLLAGEDFRAGTYELVFAVGEYFKGSPLPVHHRFSTVCPCASPSPTAPSITTYRFSSRHGHTVPTAGVRPGASIQIALYRPCQTNGVPNAVGYLLPADNDAGTSGTP